MIQESSMYAVVSTGGKQYRVEAGAELVLERLSVDAGSTVTFDRVLLVGDGEAVTVGTPTVQGASVSATVLGEVLGPKLIVFKFKQKATYRRKNGHRQHLTRVRIDEISAGGRRGGKAAKAEEPQADEAATDQKATTDKKAATAEKKPATRRRTAKAAGDGDDEPKPKTAGRGRSTKATKAAKDDKPGKAEE
jgi:large subunit ribosomal protein L21